MNKNYQHHRKILQRIAHNAMVERGLLPNFSGAAMAEVSRAQAPTMQKGTQDGAAHVIRDLRSLLWSSIDNDDSRDLDQLARRGLVGDLEV